MLPTNQWAVLIYFAGNNDLEPFLSKQFELIQNAEICPNLNVAIQFGKPRRDDNSAEWGGARRYISKNGAMVLTECLGYVNMGRQQTFIEFLLWGYSQFATDHVILIMSGHSAGFVGLMMDVSEKTLDLISIKEFAQALSYFHAQTGSNIDILLFDTCYMNLVEVWYEIAISAGHPVDFLILDAENPPIGGLPCYEIINLLVNDTSNRLMVKKSIRKIVQSINNKYAGQVDLFAISLAPEHFIVLKELMNELTILALDNNLMNRLPSIYCKPSALIRLLDLVNQIDMIFSKADTCCRQIENVLEKIVEYPAFNKLVKNHSIGPYIYLPNNPAQYLKFQMYYDILSFASNNKWLEVLKRAGCP
ncbi:MAG: clostripain-related cysteine peptidase [Veillonellales bacterium]